MICKTLCFDFQNIGFQHVKLPVSGTETGSFAIYWLPACYTDVSSMQRQIHTFKLKDAEDKRPTGAKLCSRRAFSKL